MQLHFYFSFRKIINMLIYKSESNNKKVDISFFECFL